MDLLAAERAGLRVVGADGVVAFAVPARHDLAAAVATGRRDGAAAFEVFLPVVAETPLPSAARARTLDRDLVGEAQVERVVGQRPLARQGRLPAARAGGGLRFRPSTPRLDVSSQAAAAAEAMAAKELLQGLRVDEFEANRAREGLRCVRGGFRRSGKHVLSAAWVVKTLLSRSARASRIAAERGAPPATCRGSPLRPKRQRFRCRRALPTAKGSLVAAKTIHASSARLCAQTLKGLRSSPRAEAPRCAAEDDVRGVAL